MSEEKKAPEMWVVVSNGEQGTCYVTYNRSHQTYGLTNTVKSATAFTLTEAEQVQKHANTSFKKLATDYDRFGIVSLKPTEK